MNIFVCLLTLSLASIVNSQSACNAHKSCGACISHVQDRCVWCAEDKNITVFRCQPKTYSEYYVDWCKNILEPIHDVKIVPPKKQQFSPQEIRITASPGVEVKFNVSYTRDKDFPLDVYFLMDYSYTMKKYKEELMKQALDIYNGLTNMTGNVLLGVGSFVEKPALPYANPITAYSYAFKNHLKLTNDMEKFQSVIKNSTFGSNYDDAEAGLDALMQVMVCDKQLGWRNATRRIIVLATDNTYHSAGDGKMIGAVKPNDMKCHLEDDEYKPKYSVKYDYPSVGLINEVARKGKFLIIFAVLENMRAVYTALSNQISGAKYAELKQDGNILEFIKKAYDESVNKVEIDYSPRLSSFQVTKDQECKEAIKKNCESTPNNPTVTIPITIKSLKCENETEQIITMNPTGLDETLTIKFRVDCKCKCETTDAAAIKTTSDCNGNGFKQCGACKCGKKWGGDMCEINCSDETALKMENKCRLNNSTINCNGHGTCTCGECTCTEGFTGNVCQYDPNSCDTGNNGKICGGKDHGDCTFGACHCKKDWTGQACDCPVEHKSLKQCTGPFSKKPCSGRGECDCGKCVCKKVDNKDETYLGAFCDSCEECAIERCEDLKDYSICNHNEEKKNCDDKFNITADLNLELIVANKSELARKDEWRTGTQCRTQLDDGTFLLFKYNVLTNPSTTDKSDTKLLLMIQKEVEIPPKADILVPIAAAIAGILLIGLLTVVFWKILIEWYDKREYNKFCKEAKAQGFDVRSQNPLYEPPSLTVDNPAFNRN